jgi:peptidoglycan/LPS O-acetylase OafA/YrhL
MENEVNAQGKIQILLEEYSSLRTEILQRSGHMYQLLGVGGAMFLWLTGRTNIDLRFWISLAVLLAVMLLFGWLLHRDIEKAAERLRQLELDINNRAGEELLVWERHWGGSVTGYLGRARPR